MRHLPGEVTEEQQRLPVAAVSFVVVAVDDNQASNPDGGSRALSAKSRVMQRKSTRQMK